MLKLWPQKATYLDGVGVREREHLAERVCLREDAKVQHVLLRILKGVLRGGGVKAIVGHQVLEADETSRWYRTYNDPAIVAVQGDVEE